MKRQNADRMRREMQWRAGPNRAFGGSLDRFHDADRRRVATANGIEPGRQAKNAGRTVMHAGARHTSSQFRLPTIRKPPDPPMLGRSSD